MNSTLYLDTETFSAVDIRRVGAYRYAEHQSTRLLILAWALDDGPVTVEDITETGAPSAQFQALFNDPDTRLVAHNAAFDRLILSHTQGLNAPLERWYCTAAQARAHGYPGDLDTLSAALRLAEAAKDKSGKALIRLFCSPGRGGARATAQTHPEKWAQFLSYAGQDIIAMRAAHKVLPTVNFTGAEFETWLLDQKINDRGFAVDTDLARAAVGVAFRHREALDAELRELTAGAVGSLQQRDALLTHLAEFYGVELPDLTADTVRRTLDEGRLPETAARLLALRQEAAKASTAKYTALLESVCADGRVHGGLLFCGASRTGRWSGRLFQPQNLQRPDMPSDEIDVAIQAVKEGVLDLVFDKPLRVLSNAVRGCIVAAPARKLVPADLSNIEGRVLAWLAGEEWKLEAFRAFDAGTGPDLYRKTYAESFGVSVDSVTGTQRQVGKCLELSMGYQGWVGAFLTFAIIYNVDLDALAASVMASAEPGDWARSMRSAEWAAGENRLLGLEPHVYAACALLASAWRGAHLSTRALWRELEDAFRSAVLQPGVTFRVGEHLAIRGNGKQVRIRLPSGRFLIYDSPRLADGAISFMGFKEGRWLREYTFGGRLAENVTSATARDIMVGGMKRAEAAGYNVVLTVHDEIIAEVPDSPDFTADELSALMTPGESWSAGLPLAAHGFETHRYRKE